MTQTLRICHLYGNLMNTYGDLGNILVLDYYAKKVGIQTETEVISIGQDFDASRYDIVLFGGGQDFEQKIISEDLNSKKAALTAYIENGGVMLAICGGYQLLGHYYIGANGDKIPGIGVLDHYTLSQDNSRFIGDIVIENREFNETYLGFENHNGRTFLGKDEKPLGYVKRGHGNNGEDGTEGCVYKNTFGSYFHGPILTHNGVLAKRLLTTAISRRFPEFDLQPLADLPIEESRYQVDAAGVKKVQN